ncbi:MAG: hypothetical protein MJ160_00845 [Treponema sp.]|nr:hypothetical protein [Treponema sp.]
MTKFLFLFKSYVKHLLRFVFALISSGNDCIVCGNKTYVYPVCKKCINQRFDIKKLLSVRRCSICGKEILTESDICLKCKETPVIKSLNKVVPILSYRLWNRNLLFLWKILSIRSLSGLLAKFMSRALNELGIKYIIPVPPRPGKIAENGWDQIDELCKYLEYKYGFTVLHLLERRNVIQQKKLDRQNRLKTIGSSYVLVSEEKLKKEIKKIKGEFPLVFALIDDVSTTGATLESCAQSLKQLNLGEVVGVTIFNVD